MRDAARSLVLRQRRGWVPESLVPFIYVGWDAERPTLIVQQPDNSMTSWRDVINGLAVTPTGEPARPIYSDSSFGGRRGVAVAGVSQTVTYATMVGLPSGATPFEVHGLFDQTALVADTGTRTIMSMGGIAASNRFDLNRVVTLGVNRVQVVVPNNTVGIPVTNLNVDFSGLHYFRIVVTATETRVDVDGVAGTPVPVVPALGTSRFRLFATASNTPLQFAQGVKSGLWVTSLLNTEQASLMSLHLNERLV